MPKYLFLLLLACTTGYAQDLRFDMSQHGKKMSANDFDQWLKNNRIKVVGRKTNTEEGKLHFTPKPQAQTQPVVAAPTADGTIVGFN